MADTTDLKSSIRQIYKQVEAERKKQKYDQLQEYLARERDQVLQQQAPAPLLPIAPLPATTHESSNFFGITQQWRGREASTLQIASLLLPCHESALPRHLIFKPIQKTFYAGDNKELTHVPYLGEDVNVSELLSNHDVSNRRKLIENGPEYMEEETNDLIDETLKQCSKIKCSNGRSVWEDNRGTSVALEVLSDIMKLDSSVLEERLTKLLKDSSQGSKKPPPTVAGTHASVDETSNSTSAADESDTDREYLEALDSYRLMFCRRCFTFDCNLHGILGQEDKPSLDFQTARAYEKQNNGAWSTSLLCQPCTSTESNTPNDAFSEVKELTEFHKTICKRMFIIFRGDIDKMSNAMRAPKHLIRDHVEQQGYSLPSMGQLKKPPVETRPYYSVKNYKNKWYRAIEQAEIHPFFNPCVHEGECSDESCSCVSNRMFCTNACCWGSASPNFFRGCGCKGACSAKSCTCFATKRECDPDLCSCGTCCDPPDRPAVKQQCRNDNIRMRRRKHLLIGPSTMSGWGLFTKDKIGKGEFIHEYVGELISQEEAERRGQIDDVKNRSYLFNLCSDYAIDASRMGGKTRFINHSNEPNCEARILFVNGDQRIGFYAKEDIEPESELFFDYRYNVAMNNELIDKSAMTVDWMKDDRKKPAPKRKRKSKKKRGRSRTRCEEG